MSKAAMITRMLRSIQPPLSEGERQVIDQAFRAFSERQVALMDRAGLRFWPERWGIVPEFADFVRQQEPSAAEERTHPAAYDPGTRAIYYRRGINRPMTLIHELAHVWDDLRNDRGWELRAMDSLPADSRERMSNRLRGRRKAYASDSPRRVGAARLSLGQMWELYVGRTERAREQTFDAHPTPCGYSRTNVHEFYAVGYSVFHGDNMDAKARLLAAAPEFYDYLAEEALAEGLAVPLRDMVRQHHRGPNIC